MGTKKHEERIAADESMATASCHIIRVFHRLVAPLQKIFSSHPRKLLTAGGAGII